MTPRRPRLGRQDRALVALIIAGLVTLLLMLGVVYQMYAADRPCTRYAPATVWLTTQQEAPALRCLERGW